MSKLNMHTPINNKLKVNLDDTFTSAVYIYPGQLIADNFFFYCFLKTLLAPRCKNDNINDINIFF